MIFVLHYAFAAFAKLNSDWFDKRSSCTTTFAVATLDRFALHSAFMPPWEEWTLLALCMAPFVMAVWEGIIAPLLIIPRFRLIGIAVVGSLHIVLWPIAWDYAPPIVWMLSLWAPRACGSALAFMTTSNTACAVTTLAIAMLAAANFMQKDAVLHLSEVIFLFWYGNFLLGLLNCWASKPLNRIELTEVSLQLPASVRFWRRLPAHAVIVVTVLNGASPYLGVRSQSTWSMFSNLRVEGGATNHFLFPVATQPFGLLRDIVHVNATDYVLLQSFHQVVFGDSGLSSPAGEFAHRHGLDAHLVVNSPMLSGLSELTNSSAALDASSFTMTRSTLRRLVTVDCPDKCRRDFFVEYEGKKGHVSRFEVKAGVVVHDDGQLAATPFPYLMQKLLWSRSYAPDKASRCSH
eukprot:gnl/TRDRNA2_/TRDRNA2_83212_c0_seq2.p1 gnl/TRDRNA2_/TRDRNA2_83212_c0~~gnl/TRDRNA2_/TRDRNA2_83212_c0_seq2.p1  ORF type:complete len:405 (+),score=31.57 gnl/TRDRNA2_/TRDRNA2_83212_c0_seq2:120-1334(+)